MRLLLPLLFVLPVCLFAQNWYTQGGTNGRNGQSAYDGPVAPEILWTNPGFPTSLWGGATYIEGNRFATYRYSTGFGNTTARLVIGDLLTGEALFTFLPHSNSVMLPLGICQNRLYVVDYKTQQGDTLYAIDLSTFEVLWKTPPICWNGFTSGLQFTCEGDPIVNGNVPQRSVMRLDRHTGAVVWSNNHFTTINGSNGTCMVGNRIYTWEGSLITPKQVRVLDAATGAHLFSSDVLPGDGDQEIRLTAGPDSTVYACRDGGNLYALHDTGAGFELRWQYTFTGLQPGTYSNFAISPLDGSVYLTDDGFIIRLDAGDGGLLNSSDLPIPGFSSLMTIDRTGRLYVATSGFGADGKYLAYAPELGPTLWSFAVPDNYYSAPALGREGILLVSGSGTTVRALQAGSDLDVMPVAAFSASKHTINAGETVTFTNLSSYAPVVYNWSFPGGQPATASGPAPPPVSYDTPGSYAVHLIVGNIAGIDTLTIDCLIEVLPTSATDAPAEAPLTVFPNPATDFCRLDLPVGDNEVTVLDAAGRVVHTQRQIPQGSLVFSISDWPSGYYFILIKNKQGSSSTRFCKIQRF